MQQVKVKATRTTGQHKVGQRITVSPAMAKALVLLRCAVYDDEEVTQAHPKPPFRNPTSPKKRTYKRRDMQAE
jgi:hypothetical protein